MYEVFAQCAGSAVREGAGAAARDALIDVISNVGHVYMLANGRARLRRIIDNCECYNREQPSLTRYSVSTTMVPYMLNRQTDRQTDRKIDRQTRCGDPVPCKTCIGYDKTKKLTRRERAHAQERRRERERERERVHLDRDVIQTIPSRFPLLFTPSPPDPTFESTFSHLT